MAIPSLLATRVADLEGVQSTGCQLDDGTRFSITRGGVPYLVAAPRRPYRDAISRKLSGVYVCVTDAGHASLPWPTVTHPSERRVPVAVPRCHTSPLSPPSSLRGSETPVTYTRSAFLVLNLRLTMFWGPWARRPIGGRCAPAAQRRCPCLRRPVHPPASLVSVSTHLECRHPLRSVWKPQT